LNGTSVSDQGLAALAAMRSLKIIEVIESQVTEAGALSYRAANGAAEIVLEEAVGGVL
jgi:hypothetical protein